jgi:hypothetical protein
VKDEWKRRVELLKPDRFTPKPEASRLEFDPNIRHRMPEVSNDLIYRILDDVVPMKEP